MKPVASSSRRGLSGGRARWSGIIIVLALLAAALAGCTAATRPTLSADQLEEQYGLRVAQVSLTAAGGLVDLRLKVDHAARVGQLLAKAPTLEVGNTGVTLVAAEDVFPQNLKPVDGQMLLVLFPNSGNAVKRGANVAVTFGDMRLEPITIK